MGRQAHLARRRVEYMIEHSGLARRALPKLVEPSAWLDSELTLTNLKRSLNRFRPNLAQGHLGPHLYPLSQMDDDVLTRFLGYIREAIERDERHSSFHVWKLLFIHKPGRDRYDLKGGCRPIVCLSHLLSNDERLVAALVTRHVDAVRTDVNNGYKPVTT